MELSWRNGRERWPRTESWEICIYIRSEFSDTWWYTEDKIGMGEGQGSLGGSEAGWELGLGHRWRILREGGPVQIHTSIATVRGNWWLIDLASASDIFPVTDQNQAWDVMLVRVFLKMKNPLLWANLRNPIVFMCKEPKYQFTDFLDKYWPLAQ